jgi:hypothetical protein
MFAYLLPQFTQAGQEAQAISALRQASGLDQPPAEPQASPYYSYGAEVAPSFAPPGFKAGGLAQTEDLHAKIMASPLMAASGGEAKHKGSHYVQGAGGGQDDLIPAMLADGEYVFDAEIVSALGDGSNKRGAEILDEFRARIRKHKRTDNHKSIPPKAKSPLEYLKGLK